MCQTKCTGKMRLEARFTLVAESWRGGGGDKLVLAGWGAGVGQRGRGAGGRLPVSRVPGDQFGQIAVLGHLVSDAESERWSFQQGPLEHLEDVLAPGLVQPSRQVPFAVVVLEPGAFDLHVFRCELKHLQYQRTSAPLHRALTRIRTLAHFDSPIHRAGSSPTT